MFNIFISIILIFNFCITLCFSILSIKNVSFRLITAKYLFYSGIMLLPLLIIFRMTNLIFISDSSSNIYSFLIFGALLVWTPLYLLGLIIKVQKLLLGPNQLEIITAILLYRFKQKKILYTLLFMDPKFYFYGLIVATIFSLFIENVVFENIYLWLIFITCYISLIHTRENTIFIIQHFNYKYSIDDTENSDLKVPAILGEIYRTGNSSSSWSELFQNFFKSSYSMAEDKLPRSLFPKGTPNNIIYGTCIVVGTASVGFVGTAYCNWQNQHEKTQQMIEKTQQIKQEISSYSEKKSLYNAEEAKFNAQATAAKELTTAAIEQQAVIDKQIALTKAQEAILDKEIALAKSQDAAISEQIAKAVAKINKKD